MYYFDNAATTYPKPMSVRNAVNTAIINYGGNPGRGGHNMAMRTSEKIYSVRSIAAEFFGTEPQRVIFTQNCTMSLNMAIKGVMRGGGHIILSDLEHNAVIRPIYKLKDDGIIEYSVAKVTDDNDEKTVRCFEKQIRGDTRAIICTHASNVTGAVMPIAQISALCRRYHLTFIVDAAQSAGVLPLDMRKQGIDLLCMPGHKGLYGISGTGMLLLGDRAPQLDTILEGGTGSLSAQLEQPDFPPDRFESGTLNTPGILSIGAGLRFIGSMGMGKLYQHEYTLCRTVFETLQDIQGVSLYNSSYVRGRVAPIVSFNIENMSSEVVVDRLNRMGFALRGGLHCAPLAHRHYGTLDTGMVRFAPSAFTSMRDAECFVQAVRQIVAERPTANHPNSTSVTSIMQKPTSRE